MVAEKQQLDFKLIVTLLGMAVIFLGMCLKSNWFFAAGAGVLCFPPAMETIYEDSRDDFPKMLIVLEVYLLISSLAFFFSGTVFLQFSALLLAIIALTRILGRKVQHSLFCLGVLLLGFGYAFFGSLLGDIFFTFGSALLAKASFDERTVLGKCWGILNTFAVGFGLIYLMG